MDYFENFKPFKNIYGVLDITYWVYIAFGMTPYSRIKSPNGQFIYYNMDKKKYIFVSWYIFIMLTAMTLSIMKDMEEEYGTFLEVINLFLHCQIVISSISSVTMFTARAKTLLEAYKYCYGADQGLKVLRIKPSYVELRRLALFGIMLFPINSAIQLTVHIQTNRSFNIFLRESIVYALPTVITVIPTYHFFYLGYTALNRFKMLNNYLVRDITLLSTKQIEYNLLIISKIHMNLCNCIKSVLYSTSCSLFTFYIVTYIQISALMLFLMEVAYLKASFDIFYWNVAGILTTAAFLILGTLIKYESSRTSYILCELTSSFFDDGIGTRRNTFLLQLLHQTPDLKIFGHFEVHLNRVLEDFQAVINIIMFMKQFQG